MVCSVSHETSIPPYKVVPEYQLPAAEQTHEMAVMEASSVGGSHDLLFISQQGPSRLLKMRIDPKTGCPVCVHSFTVGGGPNSGVHGLAVSKAFKGCLWATLEQENAIVLVDASKDEGDVVRRKILIHGGEGPHSVIEQGGVIYATCKKSGHIFEMKADEKQGRTHECKYGQPLYVAVHPNTKDLYVNFANVADKILKMEAKSNYKHKWISIPSEVGRSPGAVVVGPSGDVWITLMDSSSEGGMKMPMHAHCVGPMGTGVGAFGRISNSGDNVNDWFVLPSPPQWTNVGFIHVAFHEDGSDSSGSLLMWLLSSSAAKESMDAIFAVRVRGGRVVTQETVMLPTQSCVAHRIVALKSGLFVTELGQSLLAHVTGAVTGLDHQRKEATYAPPNETSDSYDMWGLGSRHLQFQWLKQPPA